MREMKQFSLKTRIIGVVMLCWFVPFLMVAGVVAYYLFGNHLEAAIEQQRMQLAFNVQISEERLNACVFSSKIISYDGSVNQAYQNYQNDVVTKESMLNTANRYLYNQYRHEDYIQDVILWFYEEPEQLRGAVYNLGTGGGYQDVTNYWEQDHDEVYEIAKDLGTGLQFYNVNGRLYLIRNLVNGSYDSIAAMVIRINKEYCFENLTNFVPESSISVVLDEQEFDLTDNGVSREEISPKNPASESGYSWRKGTLRMFHKLAAENYDLMVRVRFEDGSSLTPFYGYWYLLVAMSIFLLPLLYVILRVTKNHITEPVEVLMEGADRIEKGKLGYRVEYEPGSREFTYLMVSFNHMSKTLKHQFDHIYEEERALMDARFMALQSNINPHFMNNTLEIINWEARLSGNHKVSKMIEALSTLLDGAMDRDKKRSVLLSEEMVYVKAYLHIISERFGKRLTIYNRLPDDIMEYEVPRLILQPVIENAIEHGALKRGSGTVTMEGFVEGSYLYLEIINEAVLDEVQIEKIERLLAPDYDISQSGGNLGIANVNQRLRILYGETCGLSIWQSGENYVTARLKILISE